MNKRELARRLLIELEGLFPQASTELSNWDTPFQFLICILLSAQTTDRQVNKLTKELFNRYPNAMSFSVASLRDVEDMVRGVNYFKTKAKHIVESSKILVEKYGGEPPKDLKLLQLLPGVGYKTANVFLNDLYGANQGIAVDTHVSRVARLYGLSSNVDPTKIAHDLEGLYPREVWYMVNSIFVLYGRYILKAKKPDWDKVVLKEFIKTDLEAQSKKISS